jgi:hypothetical protein
MAQAHEELFEKILETPLPMLEEEVVAAGPESVSKVTPEMMLPPGSGSSSRYHFRYVLTVLTLLAESRSNHQAA